MNPDDVAQREWVEARCAWLLQLAGEAAKITWSENAIQVLAPKLADALAEEGLLLVRKADYDVLVAERIGT